MRSMSSSAPGIRRTPEITLAYIFLSAGRSRWAANRGVSPGSLAVSRCDTYSHGVEMPIRVHLAEAMVENVA